MAIFCKFCQIYLSLQKQRKMEYKSIITPKMTAVADCLMSAFVGMDHCVIESGRNLIVEVPKKMCEDVRLKLKERFEDVALMKNAYQMLDDLHDFILVKPLITEAPIYLHEGVMVPELEKLLVDHEAEKEYASMSEAKVQKEFQQSFELYPVNTSRLLRYAGRKGKKEEIQQRIQQIDQDRVRIVRDIQDYFRHEPVDRAWLFGSFSRMEERPDSDIDILVELDRSVPVGLLKYASMANELENHLGRKVDLVAQGSIKPYAKESIQKDSVLVYERA